jgi:hypothetical protein
LRFCGKAGPSSTSCMTHYGKSACARIAKNIMWQVYCNLTYYESGLSLPYGRGSASEPRASASSRIARQQAAR